MLHVYIPHQITCGSDWRSARTCSGCEIPHWSVYRVQPCHSFCKYYRFCLRFPLSRHSLRVFAGVHLLLSHACLTLHVAAPAYLAVTGQAGEVHGCVIATSAAQTLTTGVFGTRAAACTRGVAGGPAEAGGLFQVDQVSSAEALAVATGACELCLPGGCVGDTQHSHRGVVSILQQTSSVVERRKLLPASPYSTRAGDTVALAGCFQPALHCLRWKDKKWEGGKNEMSVPSVWFITWRLIWEVYLDRVRQFPAGWVGG